MRKTKQLNAILIRTALVDIKCEDMAVQQFQERYHIIYDDSYWLSRGFDINDTSRKARYLKALYLYPRTGYTVQHLSSILGVDYEWLSQKLEKLPHGIHELHNKHPKETVRRVNQNAFSSKYTSIKDRDITKARLGQFS